MWVCHKISGWSVANSWCLCYSSLCTCVGFRSRYARMLNFCRVKQIAEFETLNDDQYAQCSTRYNLYLIYSYVHLLTIIVLIILTKVSFTNIHDKLINYYVQFKFNDCIHWRNICTQINDKKKKVITNCFKTYSAVLRFSLCCLSGWQKTSENTHISSRIRLAVSFG